MHNILRNVERQRHDVAGRTDRAHKSAFGQFMTPMHIARFMASLLENVKRDVRLLDPCAGLGALTVAAIERWKGDNGCASGFTATVDAYEIDERLAFHLECSLESLAPHGIASNTVFGDYLLAASRRIAVGDKLYTHAMLNPPYRKIEVGSDAYRAAKSCGLIVPNLYAAFIGLALEQIEPGGELVGIIPRSFCNGVHYREFRRWIIERASIRSVHVFDSRVAAFRDDEVLQESLIIHLMRGEEQGDVLVSSSTDDTFSDLRTRLVPFNEVIAPGDNQMFLHLPMPGIQVTLKQRSGFEYNLEDLGVSVSTGPVVGFRSRDYMLSDAAETAAPMVYASSIHGFGISKKLGVSKRPVSIRICKETASLLYPAGTYVVVKRLSPKEGHRRIRAALVSKCDLAGSTLIGFDNSLNVLHAGRSGLDINLAKGLVAYLSSDAVDKYFRSFSGHTQVNAADLRALPYPSREDLITLGAEMKDLSVLSGPEIDELVNSLLERGV